MSEDNTSNNRGKTRSKNKRGKNPIYVVKNDGKDVEVMDSWKEKKKELWRPSIFFQILNDIMASAFETLRGFTLITWMNQFLKDWVEDTLILLGNANALMNVILAPFEAQLPDFLRKEGAPSTN